MNVSPFVAHWIEQHKNEIEENGENYSWIPDQCAPTLLKDVLAAFGSAGIEPFNRYQGHPADLYKWIWYSWKEIAYTIFIPSPSIASEANFYKECQTNARIANALGLKVFKYTGEIDYTKNLCPYIVTSPNAVKDFKDRYLEGYKNFVCSIKASDYKLIEEESEI